MTKFNTKREADIARVIKYLKQILCVKVVSESEIVSLRVSLFSGLASVTETEIERP
jgi:hypothetical protein